MIKRNIVFICLCLHLCISQNNATQQTHGFLDFNLYHDSREFKTYTLNVLAVFSERVHFFSLTNYNSSESKLDLETYYSEHHLRYKLSKNSPIELSKLWTHASNKSNDNLKFGLRFDLKKLSFTNTLFKNVGLSFYFSSHFIQFAHDSKPYYIPQFEYVYYKSIIKNKLYITGFADQNISWDDTSYEKSDWVTEHQIGYSIYKDLYLIIEYKYNGYLSEKSGTSFGIQYLAKF